MDLSVEKAVELGATAIVPLQSQKATVKLTTERSATRREHWQRLILAASAQCGRYHLPRLDEVTRLRDWLKQAVTAEPVLRLILDPRATQSLGAVLAANEAGAPGRAATAAACADIRLLCGPESGFSDEEYRLARDAGWLPAGLGPRVLRTETAGLVALSVIQARWGDLR
jgi:16S rRNA (uracil1498-N3)-methyltransferase